MTPHAASSKPTAILVSPSTKVFAESPARTLPDRVIYREFFAPQPSRSPAGAVDIDDLAAELEGAPGGIEAIARGRRWVGKHFYLSSSIAQIRLKKGWSQAELARRAGTSQPYIARLEQGRVDPQISTVKKIAKALGLPLRSVVEAISPEAA